MYLSTLSENLKTSLRSKTTVFPVSDRTFSFGARSTPLNLASLEEQPPHTQKGHPARDVLSFFLIYRSIIDYLFSSL